MTPPDVSRQVRQRIAALDDCAVLVTDAGARSTALVYVVSPTPVDRVQLDRCVRESMPGGFAGDVQCVPVSHIPLTADGEVDTSALLSIPRADDATVASWEAKLAGLSGGPVAILRRPRAPALDRLCLREHLPRRVLGEGDDGEPGPSGCDDAAVTASTPLGGQRLAVSDGGPLPLGPETPRTLIEALDRTIARFPDKGVRYVLDNERTDFQTYAQLRSEALVVLGNLRRRGIALGDAVILQMEDLRDHLVTFWACVLGGIIPMAVAAPPTYADKNAVSKLFNAWRLLEGPPIVTSAGLLEGLNTLPAAMDMTGLVTIDVAALKVDGELTPEPASRRPEDVMFYQLTSGSTGIPKIVQITHRGVCAHLAGAAAHNGYREDNVTFNWLPLDHVAPILMYHLRDVFLGCQHILCRTDHILSQPLRWLRIVERYRVTHSWSPNFGYKLVNEALAAAAGDESFDLSSAEGFMNAGEQVTFPVVREFLERVASFGFRSRALHPAYGMAETCTAITYRTDLDLAQPGAVHHVLKSSLHGQLQKVAAPSRLSLTFMDLGTPIPGVTIRIADQQNQVLLEGQIGRVQAKGDVITPGYLRNPEANAACQVGDGWFDTGDSGCLVDGNLVVTGRLKEMIVIQGANFYCHEIEDLVERVEGVEPTFVGVCGIENPSTGSEGLAIFFVPQDRIGRDLGLVMKAIKQVVAASVGLSPLHIVPLPKERFPKTTSGKIQRADLKNALSRGDLDDLVRRSERLLAGPGTLPHWFFEKSWPRDERGDDRPLAGATVAVLLAAPPLLDELRAAADRRGVKLIAVRADTAFGAAEGGGYEFDPDAEADHLALWRALGLGHPELSHVTYHAAPDSKAGSDGGSRLARQVLALAKSIAASRLADRPLELHVHTRHAQAVSSTEPLAPTPVGGLLAGLAAESPNLTIRTVDGDRDSADVVWRELGLAGGAREVAYRDGRRYASRLRRCAIGRAGDDPLRAGGLYLVTGGLGGVGRALCQFMLETYGCELLIVGRARLDEERKRALSELEKLGSVRYESVDVADQARLEDCLSACLPRARPLDGVFHLAAAYHDRPLVDETPDSLERILRPKVAGTKNLAAALMKRNPTGLFVGFSSVVSFFGGAMVSAYAAANRFLEDYCRHLRRCSGLKARCLSFSSWTDHGMSRGYQPVTTKGYCGMTARQGWQSLLVGLTCQSEQIFAGLDAGKANVGRHLDGPVAPAEELVAYGRWPDGLSPDDVTRAVPGPLVFAARTELPIGAAGGVDKTRLLQALQAEERPRLGTETPLEQELLTIWRELLGDPPIGPEDSFFEVGGDSLQIPRLQEAIRRRLKRELTLVDLFRHPTIRAMARHLGETGAVPRAAETRPRAEDRARARGGAGRIGTGDAVAVIGMAAQLPGARTVDEFHANLRRGQEAVRFLERSELLAQGVPEQTVNDPSYVNAVATLADPERFDAAFFNYSAREARMLDPQQRRFLECAWSAIESAGYRTDRGALSVGVFAGTSANTYFVDAIQRGATSADLDFMSFVETRLGSDKDFVATRVSYELNLIGPSFTVQSACSTSLVAVHLACQSLLRGECEMAVAGAATVFYPQGLGYRHKPNGMTSPDGHCRPFDAEARGTIFGSGVGAVVLKRIDDALADRDHVLAVIKGSALNNDGSSKLSYTAPSIDRQSAVVAEALAAAGVDPATIGYVEAHGTGTPMGDPVEVAALTQAFRRWTDQNGFCALGSVKSNIGHLDVAAGMAGLIKAILSLRHRELFPSLHFRSPNPKIDFAASPFYVNTALRPFPNGAQPRRCGVTSLGVGGTNAHVVLEEHVADDADRPSTARRAQLLILSAKTEAAFQQAAANLRRHLEERPELALADAAHTLQVGRNRFAVRAALVCRTRQEAIARLSAVDPASERDRRRLLCVVGRLGSAACRQAWLLYERDPVFRQAIDTGLAHWRDVMPTASLTAERIESRLADVGRASDAESEVAAFLITYASTCAWLALGVVPDSWVARHHGDLVIARVEGRLSWPECLRALAARLGLAGAATPVARPELATASHAPAEAPIDWHHGLQDAAALVLDEEAEAPLPYRLPGWPEGPSPETSLLGALGRLWCWGVEIDWQRHDGDQRRRRVPLPTYPFDGQRFAFDAPERRAGDAPPRDHALFDRWIGSPKAGKSLASCTMSVARFPYLADHRVFGTLIVPGSLHVAAVLDAAVQAFGGGPQEIADLAFAQALFLPEEGDREVQVVIDHEAPDDVRYQMMSCDPARASDAGAWTVHSLGRLQPKPARAVPPALDLAAIQARCCEQIAGAEFYRDGQQLGFEWDGDFRSLQALWRRDGEVLARLEHGPRVAASLSETSIHPAILDACLQPYLLTLPASGVHAAAREPYIPFTVDRLTYWRRPTARLWSHARLRGQEHHGHDTFKIDVTVTDDRGQVVIDVEGLRVIRMPKLAIRQAAGRLLEAADTVYRPTWLVEPPPASSAAPPAQVVVVSHDREPWPMAEALFALHPGVPRLRISLADQTERVGAEHLRVDHRTGDGFRELAGAVLPGALIYFLGGLPGAAPVAGDAAATSGPAAACALTQAVGVFSLFRLLKALLAGGTRLPYRLKILTCDLHAVTAADVALHPYAGSLIGLGKVLAREHAELEVGCIDFASRELDQDLRVLAPCRDERGGPDVAEVAYRDGLRRVKRLVRLEALEPAPGQPDYRRHGVYLILGGAGGIGLAFAKRLARSHAARLVLVGRRPLDEAITAELAAVERLGGEAMYVAANGTDLAAMTEVVARANRRFGAINGVVHSALVLADDAFASMSIERFRAAFDVKAAATVVLDQVTRGQPLDFFLFFSSENAIRGWKGLCNYVAGCAFKDAYARHLGRARGLPVKIFNWGYWAEAGIVARDPAKRRAVERQGIQPMSTDECLRVVEQALKAGVEQVVPTKVSVQIHPHLGIAEALASRTVSAARPPRLEETAADIDRWIAGLPPVPGDGPWLDRLLDVARYRVLHALEELGLTLADGAPLDVEGAMRDLGIAPRYEKLVRSLFDLLHRGGLLAADGDRHRFTEQAIRRSPEMLTAYPAACVAIRREFPQAGPWIDLLERCLASFGLILRGRLRAVDALFPGSSVELVERIYKDNPLSRRFNALMAEAVRSQVDRLLRELPAGENVRILEFGAGTGSATEGILAAIQPLGARVEYVITDVSQLFVAAAKDAFATRFPFAAFRSFDMERPPEEQGFTLGQYHLVIGSNVIHVCRRMAATVDRLKSLLMRGGLLMLNELTAANDLATITFGLLDGWWLYEDAALRIAHTPLLDGRTWRSLLAARGFSPVQSWDTEAERGPDAASQSLILAVSDGEILVERSDAAPKAALRPAAPRTDRRRSDGGASLTFADVESARPGERLERLQRFLRQEVARALELPRPDDVGLDQVLGDLGMDSLIVVGFCDNLSRKLGVAVATTIVFDHPTVGEMSKHLVERLRWPGQDPAAAPTADAGADGPAADLEALSAAEVEALLAAELEQPHD